MGFFRSRKPKADDRWASGAFAETSGDGGIGETSLTVAVRSRPLLPDERRRGDRRDIVRVLDDKTILIPDRVGNNRLDSMQNILDDPRVGVLCFLPGLNETLRINGRAEITTDPDLLAPSAVRGKAPKTGLVIHIDEVFIHCANAVLRSHLWDPAHHIDRADFPPIGQVYADHIGRSEEGEEIEKLYAETHNDEVLY